LATTSPVSADRWVRRLAIPPIAAILTVAAVARLWGIGFGLPHPNCRPDEGAIASLASGMYNGDLNPHSFNYPALFLLVIAATLRVLDESLGALQDLGIRWSVSVTATTTTYLVARLLSAATGIASVWVTFRVALRLFGRNTALAAAAFLALAFLHVRDSHFGVTDVPMTFMVLVAFLFIVRLSESGTTADLIAAGVAAGLASSTKYNAALVALPALVRIVAGPFAARQSFDARWRRAALFVGFMVAAFLLTSPYSVLDFRRFLADVTFESRHLAQGHGVILGRGWRYHLTSTLRYGIGIPMLFTGALGWLLLCWRSPRRGALVGLFPVSYYVVLGSGYTVFARYMLPVVPFLCLTAGYAVTAASGWLAARMQRPNWAPAMATLGVVGLLLPSAVSVVKFDRLIARTDSRLLVRRWIEQRFPPGTTIDQIGTEPGHVFLHDANEVRYVDVRLFPRGRVEPDVVIVQSSPLMRRPPNLARIEQILAAAYELRFAQNITAGDPGNVYDWQDEFYLPLTGFTGIERPGPNLRVYVRRDISPSVR
jgi:4-amino-4-deoxy-L-arabinose transferase-like glycosyltransferase